MNYPGIAPLPDTAIVHLPRMPSGCPTRHTRTIVRGAATEYSAKHKRVKKIDSHDIICAPAFPHASHEIVRRLCAAIETRDNPHRTHSNQQKVAELIGMPKTTLNEWLCNDQTEQVRRFLSGLERLPEEDRMRLVNSFCRHCPRLTDSRISHDKQTAAVIESLVQTGSGIAVITGTSDSARTYLLTAIGNSFAARQSITGFDTHPPEHFVPVPGVFYPTKRVPEGELPSLFAKIWPRIAPREHSLILLNGIWNKIRGHHSSIFKLGKKNFVLIADEFSAPPPVGMSSHMNVVPFETRGGNGRRLFRISVEIR